MYRQSLRVALCLAITATVHASPLGEVLYVGDSPRNMILAHVIGSDRLVPLSGATSIMARQAVGLGGNRVAYLPLEREGVVELDLESGTLHEFHLAAEGWRIKGLGTITGDGGICLTETNGTQSRVTVWRKSGQTWSIAQEYPISEVIYLDISPLAFADNSVIYTRGHGGELVHHTPEGAITILAENLWPYSDSQLEWGADGIAVATVKGERLGAWNAQGEPVDFAEESGVWTLLPRAIKSSTTGLIGAVSRAGDYVRSSIFGDDTTTVYTSRLPGGMYKADGDITGARSLWRRPGGGAYVHDRVGGGIARVDESGATWHYQFVSGSGPLFDGILSMGTADDGLIRLVDDRRQIFNINPATGNRTVVGTLRRGLSVERSVVLANGDLLSMETDPPTRRVRFVAITRIGAERGASEWIDAGAPMFMAALGNRAFLRFQSTDDVQNLLVDIDGHKELYIRIETNEITLVPDQPPPADIHTAIVQLPARTVAADAIVVDVDIESINPLPYYFHDPSPQLVLVSPGGDRYATGLGDAATRTTLGNITKLRFRIPMPEGVSEGGWTVRIEWTFQYSPSFTSVAPVAFRLSPIPAARSIVCAGNAAGDRLYFHQFGTTEFIVLDPNTMDQPDGWPRADSPKDSEAEGTAPPSHVERFKFVTSMAVSADGNAIYTLSNLDTSIYRVTAPAWENPEIIVPSYPAGLGAPQLGHQSGGHRFLAIGSVVPARYHGWILD